MNLNVFFKKKKIQLFIQSLGAALTFLVLVVFIYLFVYIVHIVKCVNTQLFFSGSISRGCTI